MKRKALLIGINSFTQPGSDLKGCVNDVFDIGQFLVDVMGWSGDDIYILRDGGATGQEIKEHAEKLVDSLGSGDHGLLHISSHGSSIPGNEPDGRTEIVCPCDIWEASIEDNWFGDLFAGCLDDGANLTVTLDTCHSGSATRAMRHPDSREPVPRFLAHPNDEMSDRTSVLPSSPRTSGGPRKEILLSACQDHQTAADAFIGGQWCGAFTSTMLGVLGDYEGSVSYGRLIEKVHERIARRFHQRPVLSGDAAKFPELFLGGPINAT